MRRPHVEAAGDRLDALAAVTRRPRSRVARAPSASPSNARLVDQRADQRAGLARIADRHAARRRLRAAATSSSRDALVDDQPAQRRAALAGGARRRRTAIARTARSRSADGQTITALLPPSSRSARPKRCATRGADRRGPSRSSRWPRPAATRGSSTSASPTSRSPMTSCDEPSGASPNLSHRAARRAPCTSSAQSGVFSRRLPDHRIAADQRQRRIPRPDRDREIEGAR